MENEKMIDINGGQVSITVLKRIARSKPRSEWHKEMIFAARAALAKYETENFMKDDVRIEQGYENTSIGKQIKEHLVAIENIIRRSAQEERLDPTATITYEKTSDVYINFTKMKVNLKIELFEDAPLFIQAERKRNEAISEKIEFINTKENMNEESK